MYSLCALFSPVFLKLHFGCFFHTVNDVIDHVTIRLPGVDFLWVIHSDHASI